MGFIALGQNLVLVTRRVAMAFKSEQGHAQTLNMVEETALVLGQALR